MLAICVFTIEAVAIARTNCLFVNLSPISVLKLFRGTESTALRAYGDGCIEWSIDVEQIVRIVGSDTRTSIC